MDLNLTKALRENTEVSHIVLHCLGKAGTEILEDLALRRVEGEDQIIDVTLSIDGRECQLAEVVRLWDGYMEKMIADKAKELVEEELRKIEDLHYALEKSFEEAVGDKLREWMDE